jgi:hypothetical protein
MLLADYTEALESNGRKAWVLNWTLDQRITYGAPRRHEEDSTWRIAETTRKDRASESVFPSEQWQSPL